MLPTVPLVKMLPLVFKRTRRKRPGAPAREASLSVRWEAGGWLRWPIEVASSPFVCAQP